MKHVVLKTLEISIQINCNVLNEVHTELGHVIFSHREQFDI